MLLYYFQLKLLLDEKILFSFDFTLRPQNVKSILVIKIIVSYVPINSNEPICKVPKERSNVSLGEDSVFPSTITFTFCVSLFRYTQLILVPVTTMNHIYVG